MHRFEFNKIPLLSLISKSDTNRFSGLEHIRLGSIRYQTNMLKWAAKTISEFLRGTSPPKTIFYTADDKLREHNLKALLQYYAPKGIHINGPNKNIITIVSGKRRAEIVLVHNTQGVLGNDIVYHKLEVTSD